FFSCNYIYPTSLYTLSLHDALPISALLVIYIRAHVPESPVWERHRAAAKGRRFDLRRFAKEHGALLSYAALLMTAFNYMSHGTQDRKSTRLNSSHVSISYAVFCLKK